MRLIFMGTPAFAVPTLDAVLQAGHEVAAVYTQPPRPAGRGKALSPSPVQRRAESAGIEVRAPLSLRDPVEQQAFADLGADAALVAAYGLILPPAVLAAPRFGCLNVHASLLPRWRGAAPIQRAIEAGDAETGISIMQMERGLDTGPVFLKRAIPIGTRNHGELTELLAGLGAAMMLEVLGQIPDLEAEPQDDGLATYAPKIDKKEARIDFTRAAEEVERQVRAFAPTPGAWFEYGGERIRLLAAELTDAEGEPGTVLDERLSIACGSGAVVPTRLQRPGRAAMDAGALLRGFGIPIGTRLASAP